MEAHVEVAARETPHFGLRWRDLWVAVGFVCAVAVADFALHRSPYAAAIPVEHSQNQIQLLAERMRPKPADVLIIGSSRVDAGIDPRVVRSTLWTEARDVEVARLPVMGMRAFLLHQVLRDIVAPRPPNDLLIIGLEERLFFPLGGETDDQLGLRLMGSSRDLWMIPPWTHRADDAAALVRAPLRGVRSIWELDFLWDPTVEPYLEHLWATGGIAEYPFREFTRADMALAVGLAAQRPAKRADPNAPLLASERAAFAKSLDLLASLPCKVAFVRMPVARSHDVEYAPEVAAFERDIVAAVRARGFVYVDLNRIAVLRTGPLLANPTHTNTAGRGAASRALGLLLAAPLVLEGSMPPAQRAATNEMLATEGLSLRPTDLELGPEELAAIEAAIAAEVRARAKR